MTVHFLQVSTNLLAVVFTLQLLLRAYAQHQSSIIILVALEVKLDLAEHKEVLFLLRQATDTDLVKMRFGFYSICHC